MRTYLINLDRRPDRLAAMQAQTARLGLALTRVAAVDARAPSNVVQGWFTPRGPLGAVPRGDQCCFLSHRKAWEMFLATGDAHAVILEDDVVLSDAAGALLGSGNWIAPGVDVVKLEHYGPRGQRVLLTDMRAVGEDFRLGRMLSRHTGAAAYIVSRRAADILLAAQPVSLPVDHLIFNPNNSPLFAALSPRQLLPAIARQQEFVGAASDIEDTRKASRRFGAGYVKRELVRFGYDLKLVPRQLWALARGGKLTAIGTAKP